jgi:hypothetical protein
MPGQHGALAAHLGAEQTERLVVVEDFFEDLLAETFLTSSGRRYRVRPKLLAIEVSGCHLVPVIVQVSGRGRQARAGGHGQRDVTQPQYLG